MMNGLAQNSTGYTPPLGLSRLAEHLTLAIPYKGLMLSEDVRPLHMGRDYGVFQAPSHPVFASIKDRVYLHGPGLAQTIRAFIEEVNPQRSWITLSRFTPLATAWRDRQEERVQPSKPLQVRLFCSTHVCYGSIDNLSRTGIGILVYHLSEKQIRAEIGTRVKVEFLVDEKMQPNRVEAEVMTVKTIGRSLAKIGLRLYPSRKHQLLLENYIQNRRQEIYTELDQDWMSWQEPRLTKDLFF